MNDRGIDIPADLTNGQIITGGQGPTKISDARIQNYSRQHKCTPFEAFTALLAEDLNKKIDAGEHAFVLKVLVENVIGGGTKR